MDLSPVRWVYYGILIAFSWDSSCAGKGRKRQSDEQRLLAKLMLGYEKAVRPVYNASDPVEVRLGITLTQIFDVDERNQVLTLNIWLDQEWIDQKLIWNPDDFGGLSMIRIPCTFIWRPDIVLYNSVDDYSKGYMKALSMVGANGNVFWPPIVRLRSSCKLDITYFPFDDQICKLKMGSWAYDGYQVDVTNRTHNVDLSNYVDHGEWELVETKVRRHVIRYPCCDEPFPDVTFYLHLRRRTLYYTFNVIVPCVLLSSLTLVGFMLPPDSGEKVTLGLTVLLAFSVFMLLIAESMPPTSEFAPLIGVYLTVVMAMTSISVVSAVVILNIHHKGIGDKRPPQWLRYLVLAGLSRLMCLHKKEYERIAQTKARSEEDRPMLRPHQFSSFRTVFKDGTDGEGTKLGPCINNTGDKELRGNITVNAVSQRPRNSTDDEIVRHLRILIDKQEKADFEINIIREWQDIAIIIDRFLFWLFFIVTTVSTVAILLLRPMYKNKHIPDDD